MIVGIKMDLLDSRMMEEISSSFCVFKPKGYNSVNVPRGERDGSSRNDFSYWAS